MTAAASDAPQRAPGVRARSGNAMLRTRASILAAAGRCVEQRGVRRTTMSDIAATGGVAKATLYNHFRTKHDVLAALVDAHVAVLAQTCTAVAMEQGLAPALERAAEELGSHRPLRRVATEEPALLSPLLTPGDGRGWLAARAAVAQVLRAAGVPAPAERVELVLRWLLSQLLWPVEQGCAGACSLAAGLGAVASTVPSPGSPVVRPQVVGLGWPGAPATLGPT